MSGRPAGGRVAVATLLAGAVLSAGCDREPVFEALSFPGAAGSAQPRLTSALDGAPLLSWIEPDGEGGVLRYARFAGDAFGEPREIVRSERMLVNWADFPSVTPITSDLWFAHWLRKRDRGFAYDVATSISRDGGASWSDAGQLNEDDAEAEHGFVSVIAWDARFGAFWLDGRELATASLDGSGPLPGTSLRLASIDKGGVIEAREIVDGLVCDCCQPDVALTSAGPIVTYRDRTEEEIRDVVVRRHVGDRWSEPVGLGNEGWFIEGCPVNGPVVAAREDDVVAAWFTAASNSSRVRFARSVDAGASFGAAVDVDVGRALGQPAIVLDADGRALVTWWRRGSAGGIDLMLRRFERDDSAGEPIALAHEDIGIAGDVPQLIAAGADYIVAWTTFAGGGNVSLLRLHGVH
jgi:hypothetical protein